MIAVEILESGEFLDLYDDTAIDLWLNNPLFADDDVIPGSISLPFDVPGSQNSATNGRLLKNPEVVSNLLSIKKAPARIWYSGVPWKIGQITVRQASPRRISLNFKFGLATEELKKKRIRELLDEVITMSSNSFVKRVSISLADASPTKLIINSKEYEFTGFNTSPTGPVINGSVYTAYPNTTDGANRAFTDSINATPNGVTATYVAPYIVVEVLESNNLEAPLKIKVDPANYWVIISSDFEGEYNLPIEDFLNDNFAPGASSPGTVFNKVRFPVCANNIYEADVVTNAAVNYYSTIGYRLNTPVSLESLHEPDNRTSICPFVRWKYVLEKVFEELGIAGSGEFLDDPDLETALIPHSNCLDFPVALAGSRDWLACLRKFNIKDLVPDWTIAEFLKALQKCFNLGIEYNESTKHIEFTMRESMHADRAYKDIQPIMSPIGDVDPQDITGVRLKVTRNTRDQLSIDDQFEAGDQTSVEEIVSEISGWYLQEARALSAGHTWDVPVASLKKDSSISPAMIFYAVKTAGLGIPFDYPGANIDMSDCTFALAGAGGRALVRWKRHLRFLLNRRAIPVEIAFEFRDLLSLDWKKKVRPVDGLNCYINSIKARLTMKGVETSKCELWTTDLGILPED